MDLCLEHLMNQEKEFSTKVSTLAQTEQALKRMDSLESNAQVSVVQSYFLHVLRHFILS